GGGGGDDDETGADGGGGGGGSSYAHPDHVDNPSFESGVNWGHGRVLLYYQLVPTATTFSGGQVNQNEMSFDLIMNQYIQDLTPDDFVFSSGTCEIYEIAVNLSVANIRARNCSHGEIGLTLKPRSVGELERGPLTSQTAWASNDRQGPTLTMTAPAGVHSTSEIVIPFSFSELTPSTESFSLPGCDAQIRESSLVLTNCASGSHQVSVRSFIADDFWGNSGPISQTVQFSVDHTAPALSFSATVSGTTSFSYELALHFSETVVIAPDAISFSSSMTCSPLATNLSQECGYGEVSWRINTASISDLVGYPVGSEIIEVSLSNPEPVISQAPSVSEPIVQVVNPEPAVTPQPTEPGPSPDPGPAIVVPPTPTQEIQTSSDSVTVPSESEPVTQSPTEPAIELEIEPVIQEPWLPSWSEEVEVATLGATTMRPRIQVREQSKEPAASEISASKSDITPEVESQPREEVQTVAGPKLEIESKDSWPWLEISVAVLLIGLIGFGAYRTIGR
ncbi:MAG: hypothetical protein EBS38_02020, partial [Actinobacteria bacterium]|nr:hypothetical protein [Actinomycetota bacterium]